MLAILAQGSGDQAETSRIRFGPARGGYKGPERTALEPVIRVMEVETSPPAIFVVVHPTAGLCLPPEYKPISEQRVLQVADGSIPKKMN